MVKQLEEITRELASMFERLDKLERMLGTGQSQDLEGA